MLQERPPRRVSQLVSHGRSGRVRGTRAQGLRCRDRTGTRGAREKSWYSPWLWNVLGDCLFCLERYDGAHEAYLQASRIDGHDARTQLNLAYTLTQRGAHGEALAAVACGLASDVQGHFRTRLLEKQQQILLIFSNRWLAEQERLARRHTRLHS